MFVMQVTFSVLLKRCLKLISFSRIACLLGEMKYYQHMQRSSGLEGNSYHDVADNQTKGFYFLFLRKHVCNVNSSNIKSI